MRTFPIMLNLSGRRCVVVGGGAVGLRRAASLAAAGADVLLVAAHLTQPAPPGVRVQAERYTTKMVQGAALVFAATDDRELNARIAADGRAAGALANAADQPDDCDFYMPAVASDGDVLLAVGTGGSAPGLAGWIRDVLAEALPDRVGTFAAELVRLRDRLRDRVPQTPRRMSIMKQLSGPDGYACFAAGGAAGLEQRLEDLLAECK
jgi:precorrin-2 dehydrogenase/sirohydrochlorin ferrochelatase